MYEYYGTNEFNFERLDERLDYRAQTCADCGAVIELSKGGYAVQPDGKYLCAECDRG